MSDALPLKYRPKTFSEMIGNESAIESIKNIMQRELTDIPSAWLLAGHPGSGKTTIARIMKTELECNDVAYFEFNSSNSRGIDTIRQIQENAYLSPMIGKTKVYLLDECHLLTPPAQNAALKMLEDAPKNVFFILATTNPEKLIKPILSRCTTIQLQKCTPKKIEKLLERVSKAEGVSIPPAVMKRIGEASDGTPRDALKMLDMVIDMTDEKLMVDAIESIVPDESNLYDFVKMLVSPKTTWKEIAEVLKNTEMEPEAMRRGILNLLGSFLLKTGDIHTAQVAECFERNVYDSGKAGLILACLATRSIE